MLPLHPCLVRRLLAAKPLGLRLGRHSSRFQGPRPCLGALLHQRACLELLWRVQHLCLVVVQVLVRLRLVRLWEQARRLCLGLRQQGMMGGRHSAWVRQVVRGGGVLQPGAPAADDTHVQRTCLEVQAISCVFAMCCGLCELCFM